MTKSELRKTYLARQRALSLAEREAKSRAIADLFFQNTDLSTTGFLHCFIPIQKFNEIDTSFIFERLWSEFPKITTLVPKVVIETGEMENLIFEPETELVQNAWNIHEPTHDRHITTENIDVVLVPGLAFDLAGHRVGYGKGFYDRLLARCRPDCLKIGVNYFAPIKQIADTGAHDVRLDRILTPERVLKTKVRRENDETPR